MKNNNLECSKCQINVIFIHLARVQNCIEGEHIGGALLPRLERKSRVRRSKDDVFKVFKADKWEYAKEWIRRRKPRAGIPGPGHVELECQALGLILEVRDPLKVLEQEKCVRIVI